MNRPTKSSSSGASETDVGLKVVHMPWLSRQEFATKVRDGPTALSLSEIPSDKPRHWRSLAVKSDAEIDHGWDGILTGSPRNKDGWRRPPEGPTARLDRRGRHVSPHTRPERCSVITARRVMALFEAATRRRFALAVIGSSIIALAEVGAMLLILPLMALIVGGDAGSSVVDRLDTLFGDPSDERLAAYIAGVVLFGFVFKGLAAMAIRWWSLTFINREAAHTAGDLLRYYLTAPMSLHVRRGTADLLRTLNDALGQVYGAVIGGGMTILVESITIVTMAGAMLLIAPLPTLAVAAYFGLAGYTLQRAIKSRAIANGQRLVGATYMAGRTALQSLGGIREIKLRNEQEVFVDAFMHHREVVGEANRTSSFISEMPKYALEILFILGVGIMTVAAYSGNDPEAALGILAVFAVAGFRLIPSTVRLLGSVNVVRNGLPSLDLIEPDIEGARRDRKDRVVRTLDRLPFHQDLVLDDVSFRYPDSAHDVVKGLSLRLPAGTSLALVGASGAGKSTMVDLILGLQRPTRGRILVDGVDIGQHLSSWQANLAMVPQDVYLLDMTLKENVHFSPVLDDPGDERLHRVLRQTQLDDLVSGLEHGVDTGLGERGGRLSGGQRQRVGIARALFRRPTLLVLDEATSALDNVTERQITDTMSSLQGDVTLVVVAHRLSTVRHCDQIAFMEDGEITALGTFDQLRLTSAGFARLVELGSLDSVDERVQDR